MCFTYSMCDCYKDLEAISLFTLENCIPVLSPEWLQSLILGSPSFFKAEVRDIVQDHPERCLTLLQVYIPLVNTSVTYICPCV